MTKKGLLALGMVAIMGLTTACSGGGGQAQTAAPAENKTEAETAAASGEITDTEITEPVTIKFANYAFVGAGL